MVTALLLPACRRDDINRRPQAEPPSRPENSNAAPFWGKRTFRDLISIKTLPRKKQGREGHPAAPPLATCSIYFLWQVLQFAASLDFGALVPLWQTPQFSPLFIVAMVILSTPFFIWKILGLV